MKLFAISGAVVVAGAMVSSPALAQKAISSSRPVASGHHVGGGFNAGRGGFHRPGHVRHRKPVFGPLPDQIAGGKQVFRHDDRGWWNFNGFAFDNRINNDNRWHHKRHRGGDDIWLGYEAGYGYGGDGDYTVGYYGGEPADFFGFFGNGGRVHHLSDGSPVYEYDRNYPYEYAGAGSPREARAPETRSYPVAASCSTQLVPSATSTLHVPVRVCRGR